MKNPTGFESEAGKFVGRRGKPEQIVKLVLAKPITLILVYFLSSLVSTAQQPIFQYNLPDTSGPRMKMDASKPGHYEMVVQMDKSDINPGEELVLNVYFSGYGEIGASKVFISWPEHIFGDSSFSFYSLGKATDGTIHWGVDSATYTDMNESGETILNLRGGHFRHNERWIVSTPFMDYLDVDTKADSQAVTVLTEVRTPEAPLLFRFKVQNGASWGTHSVNMVFTYFNGSEWTGAQQSVVFKINNPIEHYPLAFTILALIISCLGAPWFFVSMYGQAMSVISIAFKWIKKITIKRRTKSSTIKTPPVSIAQQQQKSTHEKIIKRSAKIEPGHTTDKVQRLLGRKARK